MSLTLEEMRHDRFINVIKHYEGFYSEPYKCPAGKWTIGYGHLCNADTKPITQEEATELLYADLADAYQTLKRTLPDIITDNEIPDHRAMALISWIFNLGASNFTSSTMYKHLLAKQYDKAAQEMLKWDKATDPKTGKKRALRGLTKRRKTEATYFMSGIITIH